MSNITKKNEMTKMDFVIPNQTKAVSITGSSCSLSCAHCKGHYLKHMEDQWGPYGKGNGKITSYLISGGCDSEGAVPLVDNFEYIKKLSADYKVIAHTGLIKKKDIELVSPYLDAASFNMMGNDETISEIYNLDKSVSDFITCYDNLKKKVKTFPHITMGLHNGKILGEYDAVDLLAKHGASTLVFNVIIPTKGTEFHEVEPPGIKNIIDVISYAKQRLKDAKIYLGCMRPGGLYREKLDERVVNIGIDRIVMPAKSARQKAQADGVKIQHKSECCIL
jgi:uncharacterized radical SAM superfamily protein